MAPPLWSLPGRALRDSLAADRSLATLRRDAVAGVVTGLVALPLSMALAVATGVPPQHGLYTAIVAGALIALVGGCRTQVSGPTAAFLVVLAPIVATHGLGGLCLATAMAGVLLLGMGLLRLGGLIKLVPFPVTTGFTLGIAVVIAIGQVPDLLGIPAAGMDPHPLPRLVAIGERLHAVAPVDLALGIATLVLLRLWPRFSRRVPAPLVALTAATALGEVLRQLWPGLDYATLGERFSWVDPAGAQHPGIPPWPPHLVWPWDLGDAQGAPLIPDLALLRALLPAAATIAMLGAIESLLSATIADGMAGTEHDPDAELLGQGVGNIVAPFFGGFAATGAIARTATNIRAGARTPVAAVVHSLFVLVSMLVLAPWLGHLPMAALAGLLMMVAWNMAELRHVVNVVRTAPGHDVGVLACCASLTVAFDMVVAVLAGTMLASLLFMRRMAEISRVEVLPRGHEELDADVPDGALVYSVAGPLFFGAAGKAMSTITATPEHRIVILAVQAVPAIDATGLVNLRSALARLRASGIPVIVAGLRDQPARAVARAGVTHQQGVLEFAPHVRAALVRARALLGAAADAQRSAPEA